MMTAPALAPPSCPSSIADIVGGIVAMAEDVEAAVHRARSRRVPESGVQPSTVYSAADGRR